MRFVLSLVAIVLAFVIGVFAEHDFSLIDHAKHQAAKPEYKTKRCRCKTCNCCKACKTHGAVKCDCEDCDCCPDCPGK
jgi:hypothetical protein